MTYANGGYSDHLSVSAIQRMHTEAVLGKIGNEKVEHLERCKMAVDEAVARYKQDPKLDTEQGETLMKLQAQVNTDLQQARQHAAEMMPEDDGTRAEP